MTNKLLNRLAWKIRIRFPRYLRHRIAYATYFQGYLTIKLQINEKKKATELINKINGVDYYNEDRLKPTIKEVLDLR